MSDILLFILKKYTPLCYYKEIYKYGKITGAVRILKGQEILPDDSSLVHHKISDGNTINIIIEPDVTITVQVKYNSKIFGHATSCSSSVHQLKQLLYDQEQVIFPVTELELLHNEVGLDDIT